MSFCRGRLVFNGALSEIDGCENIVSDLIQWPKHQQQRCKNGPKLALY